MWPLSLANTPTFCTPNASAHCCYIPNYILLSIPLVFQGAGQLWAEEELWWHWPTPLRASVSAHEWMFAHTSILHTARVDRCLPAWDVCGRYGNVWINVTRPHLAVRITPSHLKDTIGTASYRGCNSLQILLSITFTICPSVIHLRVPHSRSFTALIGIIIRLWDTLIGKCK